MVAVIDRHDVVLLEVWIRLGVGRDVLPAAVGRDLAARVRPGWDVEGLTVGRTFGAERRVRAVGDKPDLTRVGVAAHVVGPDLGRAHPAEDRDARAERVTPAARVAG